MKPLFFVILVAVPTVAFAQDESRRPSANASRPVSFEREVLPLLEKRCNKCHHADEQQGGLDLTRRETIERGGDELGAGVIPGKPDASPLIQVLTGQAEPAMPGEGNDERFHVMTLIGIFRRISGNGYITHAYGVL